MKEKKAGPMYRQLRGIERIGPRSHESMGLAFLFLKKGNKRLKLNFRNVEKEVRALKQFSTTRPKGLSPESSRWAPSALNRGKAKVRLPLNSGANES